MTATKTDYDAIFEKERRNEYPEVASFEQRAGYAIDRDSLERAARGLACPLKRNPPCWQHGRVIYAAVRRYLKDRSSSHHIVDIGTAKGFSALMMALAVSDGGHRAQIVSLDVINPLERVSRNSVLDLDGPKTLREYLVDWPQAEQISFLQATAVKWLAGNGRRIHFAFIDGKHTYDAVAAEADLIRRLQLPGDVIVFDDIQIDGVAKAVAKQTAYEVEYVTALPDRKYAVAVKH